jgi:HAE1 family hydrophobic/amphiphilic exporter-1
VQLLVIPAALVVVLALLALPRWRRGPTLAPARPARFTPAGNSFLDMVIELNRGLVTWTLRHRLAATGLGIIAFFSIVIPISGGTVAAFGEDAQTESARFNVAFEAPFTLGEAEEELFVYEEWLEERKAELGFDHWSNRFDDHGASIAIYYDARQAPKLIEAVQDRLKEELPRVPGHKLRFYDDAQTTVRSKTVATFRLVGPDSGTLERLGAEAQRILEDVPGLRGVTNPRVDAPEQVRVGIDRDTAHELGLSTEAVQQTISYVLHGFQLPRYQEEGRDVPLLIEYDEDKVAGLASLRDLGIWSGAGVVPLSSFADLSYAKGSRVIMRRQGRTSFVLTAEVTDPLAMLATTERTYRALAELDLPRGYEFDRSDSARSRQSDEFAELGRALLLGVVLVFLLMGILFESVLLPFSVLFTIPFAIMGAMWTLFLTGTPMDARGWIGLIILAGVVVNNGIVLIDRIHRLHSEGVPRGEAVITGCANRVRPVLMTALTTVSGLIPMALAKPTGDGFDYRSLATIVAGGLACSTFFTLWVVPLAYTVFDDLGKIASARMRWWLRRPNRVSSSPGLGMADSEVGA